MEENNNLIIYKNEDGNIDISVKLENETIWLTQKTMAELFECSTDNISLHLKNIYQEEELNKNATAEDFSVVQIEGNRQVNRTKTFYNLDAIIAVGYRVNSKRATQFRIWATNVLRLYLTKGYVVNERQLKQEQAKVKSLQDTINLLSRSLNNQVENLDEAKQVAQILNNFAAGLDLLDDFDHKTLETKGKTTREAVVIEEAE